MKAAGPLGGLASWLLFLTGLPAGVMTAMIWNSVQAGSRFWFDPVDTTLTAAVLAWAPLWMARVALTIRRVGAASVPDPRRRIKVVELVALAAAAGLFGLGFALAPTRMN